METTSPRSASEPVPQPSSLQLLIDHRGLVFSVFQCWHPAVCSHPGVWWRGKHRRLGSCLLGALQVVLSYTHSHCQGDRADAARGAHQCPQRCVLPPSLPPLCSLSLTHSPPPSPAVWLLASTLHCLRVSLTPVLGWLFTHLTPLDLSDFIPAFPLGTKLVIITFSTPRWAVALPS